MTERAVVIVKRKLDGSAKDLDIPLDITLHELIVSLNVIFGITTDQRKMGLSHLSVENPIALMKGNRLLKEYGLHDGSIIHIKE